MGLQVKLALAAVAAVLVFGTAHEAAQARPAGSDPRSLAVQVVKWNFLGEYGRIWQMLDPRFQRITTRTFWENCKRKNAPAGVTLKSIKAIDSYPDQISLPVVGKLKVTAVALEMRYTHPALQGVQTAHDTVYWERYRGQWKGLWTLADYQAYSHHRCPRP